jgi:hypothetical protein
MFNQELLHPYLEFQQGDTKREGCGASSLELLCSLEGEMCGVGGQAMLGKTQNGSVAPI